MLTRALQNPPHLLEESEMVRRLISDLSYCFTHKLLVAVDRDIAVYSKSQCSMEQTLVSIVILSMMFKYCVTQPSIEDCVRWELSGLHPSQNMISVEENSYINLTFYTRDDDCKETKNLTFIKLSRLDEGLQLDLCKCFLDDQTLLETTRDCRCSDNQAVQGVSEVQQCYCTTNSKMIQLSAKSPTSDIALYIWKWAYSDRSEEQKEAFIVSAEPHDRKNATYLATTKEGLCINVFIFAGIMIVPFLLGIMLATVIRGLILTCRKHFASRQELARYSDLRCQGKGKVLNPGEEHIYETAISTRA